MRLTALNTAALLSAAFISTVLYGCKSHDATANTEQPAPTRESSVDLVELDRAHTAAANNATTGGTDNTNSASGTVNLPGTPAPGPATTDAAAARRMLSLKATDEAERLLRGEDVVGALRQADMALELDPSNARAAEMRATLKAMTGSSGGLYSPDARDGNSLRSEALYEVRRRVTEAENFLRGEQYTEAVEAAESALDVLRWAGQVDGGDTWRSRAGEIVRQAKNDRESSRLKDAAKIREQQRREQELLAIAAVERYRDEIRNLYNEARDLFDRREYKYAIIKLDQILRKDPFNEQVIELRQICESLERGVQRKDSFEQFGLKWRRAVAEIEEASIFPTADVRFPSAEDWANTEARRDRVLGDQNTRLSKEDLAVRAGLERDVTLNYPDGVSPAPTLKSVLSDLAKAAGVLIVPKAGTDVNLAAEITGIEAGKLHLKHALNLLAPKGAFSWRVSNGAIIIDSAASEVKGKGVYRIFQVADILINLKNFIADEPRLNEEANDSRFVPEPANPAAGDEGPDKDKLIELIKALLENFVGDSGDGGGGAAGADTGFPEPSIRQHTLVITNTLENVNRVAALLEDLRRSQGLVVNIEARFITIRNDFLEDIGIDFRGVGGSPAGSNPVPVAAALDDVNFGTSNVPAGVGSDNEAGFFLQDVNGTNAVNYDTRGRVELLFDQAVGGRRGGFGLTNFGGASMQLAFIDNPEINAVLRAVKKKERAVLLTSPRISVHNTQRGFMSVLSELSYISDFDVNVSANAAIADPIVQVIRDGIVLDVRPTVSADRRYVMLELRPTLATLLRPIATITTSLGVGPPVSIQTPELQLQRIRTTVTVPDGGSFLIGGLRRMIETDLESGVPILSDLPIVGWLFTRKALVSEQQDIIVIVSVSIMDVEEQTTLRGLNDK
jgi:tetratricopeptide (TPR) repeat protein